MTNKGIEIVKREFCKYVQTMMTELWDLLRKDSRQQIIRRANELVNQFFDPKTDIKPSDLARSVQYNLTKNKPAHAILAERLAKTHPHLAPQPGDRFEYVVCTCLDPKLALHERIYHVKQVEDDPNLKPDRAYYYEHQLKNCLERFFFWHEGGYKKALSESLGYAVLSDSKFVDESDDF